MYLIGYLTVYLIMYLFRYLLGSPIYKEFYTSSGVHSSLSFVSWYTQYRRTFLLLTDAVLPVFRGLILLFKGIQSNRGFSSFSSTFPYKPHTYKVDFDRLRIASVSQRLFLAAAFDVVLMCFKIGLLFGSVFLLLFCVTALSMTKN